MKHLSTLFVLLLFALALTALGDDKPADKDTDNELEAKQQEWKEKLEAAKKTGKLELLLPNVKELMLFIYIPPGKYFIGLAQEQRDFLVAQSVEPMIAHNIPAIRTIELTDGFFILDREVTKQQWEAGYKDKPTDSLVPITNEPWIRCVQYCTVLSNYQKLNVRLPTEIEWECAARGGDDRLLPWTTDYRSFFEKEKGEKVTKAVALNTQTAVDKTPLNIFNLSDNVSEWCFNEYRNQLFDFIEDDNAEIKYAPSMLPDCYIEKGKNLYPKESLNSPRVRTYRGGAFQDKDYNHLIPIRRSALETEKSPVIGFRLVIPCDAWNWQPPKKEEPKKSPSVKELMELEKIMKPTNKKK
ncbi:hypothetical protein FACS1894189_5510 [Planctomycetales bacterium]|nr:hypothetical protein FACS1894189_5510 [Planctomycetales bacterium]